VSARFGAYEILHELKSGGMGAVLLGRRRGPGTFEQLVAIKTIRAEYAAAAAVRAMFLDEAAILARINHPGIATVHDFGEENGTLYMVMEYVAGNSFRGLVEHRLPPVIAARAIAEAARGLHAAHEARDSAGHLMGLVHRDISPDNLMLGFDGHVKVIDFGIALVKNRQAPVTEFGTVKGKPPYMSPEQVKNEAMDRRSDVFSLAVVLHELLTGQGLFEGDSIYAIARAVEHQEIKPPSVVLGEPLPIGLDAVVMNALDRDLARRTPTAAQLGEELERVISTSGDETLAAWADRELAEPRAAHRVWLTQVVTGKDTPAALGRPSGAVTALGPRSPASAGSLDLGPDALAGTQLAAVTPVAPDPAPGASTHLPPNVADDSSLDRPPRRSLLVPVLVALLLLVAVIGGVMMMRGGRATTRDAGVVPADAAVVIPSVDAAIDAAIDAAPPEPLLDAATVPADAPRRLPLDAGRSLPRDASVAAAVVDAAPAAATGAGLLNIRHKTGGMYLNVVIDGHTIGVTPMLKKSFPAGKHTLQLLAPDTGEIVFEQAFELADGQTVNLQQR
jgi:serine/threonine-protein kinase